VGSGSVTPVTSSTSVDPVRLQLAPSAHAFSRPQRVVHVEIAAQDAHGAGEQIVVASGEIRRV
jgi:hypothetical protein